MHAVADAADSLPVGTERGAKIQARLETLGISDREFAERSGIDRKALRRAANGEPVRPSTVTAVETWLDRLEREVGIGEVEPLPEGFEYVGDPSEQFVSFEVSRGEGPDRLTARVVVKGPVTDPDRLLEQASGLLERALRLAADKRDKP